jgi:hypothetical protein
MAGRVGDADVLPWPRLPKDLAEFRPEQWDGGPEYGDPQPVPPSWNELRRRWYGRRASVARSLGRPALPEHTGFAARPDWVDPRFPDVVEP